MKMVIFSPRSDPLQLQQGLFKKKQKKNLKHWQQFPTSINIKRGL